MTEEVKTEPVVVHTYDTILKTYTRTVIPSEAEAIEAALLFSKSCPKVLFIIAALSVQIDMEKYFQSLSS